MGEGSVVVAGGMNMDIQGRSRGPFRVGDSNPGDALLSPGGVGRNIAENIARLGVGVELLTVIGDDPISQALVSSCTNLRIGLRGSLRLRATAASLYLCLLDGGTLVGAVSAMDALESLTPERLEERSGLLDGAAILIVDANLHETSIAWIAARYGRGGERRREGRSCPLLLLDPVSTAKAVRAKASIGAFDAAKPNRAELAILAGQEPGDPGARPMDRDALRAACARLRGRGLGELLVSLGPEGFYYEGPNEGDSPRSGFIDLPALPVQNVSGAGDASLAAFAWGLLKGRSLPERAALAAAAAALTASAPGTVSEEISPARLDALVQGASP